MTTLPRLFAFFLVTAAAGAQAAPPDAPVASAPTPASTAAAVRTETIVFIRHGEKPADDKGQLSCRGLNRALALPGVLLGKYGVPAFIFAPCTTEKKDASGASNSYVRPLATIEPTAIQLDMPVDARFAYDDAAGLERELSAPKYATAIIFVAWEHKVLDNIVKDLLLSFGADAALVPAWPAGDFDSIFVVRVATAGDKRTAAFEHDHEGLDTLSDDCPGTPPK